MEDEDFFEKREDLTDWELICVISYLHQLIGRDDSEMIDDFEMLREKYFSGDANQLIDVIDGLINTYENEYTDRHKN